MPACEHAEASAEAGRTPAEEVEKATSWQRQIVMFVHLSVPVPVCLLLSELPFVRISVRRSLYIYQVSLSPACSPAAPPKDSKGLPVVSVSAIVFISVVLYH